jgi:putative RNA 2'-phosphotransferase
MDSSARKRWSKRLSYHLRHAPEELGLALAPGGWVAVDALLAALDKKYGAPSLSRDQLAEIVATNDKRRFSFSDDDGGARIRANQGHSVEVDLQLEPATPPPILYHGTATRFLSAIRKEGLTAQGRHAVHLSRDEATARSVGGRHGTPIVLVVDAARLHAAGALFSKSANDVWLVDAVPPEYLTIPDEPNG